MTDAPDAAAHASEEGAQGGDSQPLDLASWGITKKPTPGFVGARVPNPVAEQWNATVAEIAKMFKISKGNAAACGLLVAILHSGEWASLAREVNGQDRGDTELPVVDRD